MDSVWVAHLCALECETSWTGASREYVIDTVERLLVGLAGAYPVRHVLHELRDACLHACTLLAPSHPARGILRRVTRRSAVDARAIYRQQIRSALCRKPSCLKWVTS